MDVTCDSNYEWDGSQCKRKSSGGGGCAYNYFSCSSWHVYSTLQSSSSGLSPSGYIYGPGSVCLTPTSYSGVYSGGGGYVYAPSSSCFS